jgi:hypothetical protein
MKVNGKVIGTLYGRNSKLFSNWKNKKVTKFMLLLTGVIVTNGERADFNQDKLTAISTMLVASSHGAPVWRRFGAVQMRSCSW